MEEELSKSKIVFAAAVGIVFVVMVGLFIVAATKQDMQPPANKAQNLPLLNKDANEEEINVDEIEFADPGDDEIGKEVKELDDLINDTRPSELSGDDLSDDLVGGDLELE